MNDWGLLVFLVFSFLVGVQLLAIFVIDPLVKKKEGKDYKFNRFAVIFTIIYLIYVVSNSILLFFLTGGFE